MKKGSSLPDFSFTLEDGRKVQASDYRGKPLLVHFWASWEGRSRAETFRVRRMLKGNQGKIEAVSISLDVNDAARKGIERMDSVSWTSYCDFSRGTVLWSNNSVSVPFLFTCWPERTVRFLQLVPPTRRI